jgi:hypothetical protein
LTAITPAKSDGKSGFFQQSHWSCFVVDARVSKVFAALHGELEFHLSLLDDSGEVIAEDRIPLKGKQRGYVWSGQTPWLAQAMRRSKTPQKSFSWSQSLFEGLGPRNRKESWIDDDMTVSLFVAPLAFHAGDGPNSGNTAEHSVYYVPWLPYRCKFTLKEEELERMKAVKGTVLFKPAKKEENP